MKRALIVYGGWNGHEPEQCKDVIAPWLRTQDFEVRESDTLEAFTDDAMMADLDVIIPAWTMGELKGEPGKALMAAIRGGVGLAGWHGGMCDAFRSNTEYQFMTGGQFVTHPGGIRPYRVVDLAQDDAVTAGLSDFGVTSEQYYMHVDPGNTVLAWTVFDAEVLPWIDGTRMPVVWKRWYGKGRVFYSALGHVAKEFEVEEVMTITQRGILWAAGVEAMAANDLLKPY